MSIELDATKRLARRSNAYALSGGVAGVGGYGILDAAHGVFTYYFPSAPDDLWQLLVYVLALVLGAIFGKAARTLE